MRTTVLLYFVILAASVKAVAGAAEWRSEEGHFLIKAQTDPQRPVVGNNVVILTILDGRSRAPVEAATVEVVPWMTMHGHGSSKKTRIRERGGGAYVVEDVFFTMAGDWDLLITLRKEKIEDKGTVPIRDVK